MSAAPWMPLDCARLAHGLTGSGRVGAQLEEPYKRIFIICNGVDSPEGEVELFSKLLTDLRDKCALEDVASGSAPPSLVRCRPPGGRGLPSGHSHANDELIDATHLGPQAVHLRKTPHDAVFELPLDMRPDVVDIMLKTMGKDGKSKPTLLTRGQSRARIMVEVCEMDLDELELLKVGSLAPGRAQLSASFGCVEKLKEMQVSSRRPPALRGGVAIQMISCKHAEPDGAPPLFAELERAGERLVQGDRPGRDRPAGVRRVPQLVDRHQRRVR